MKEQLTILENIVIDYTVLYGGKSTIMAIKTGKKFIRDLKINNNRKGTNFVSFVRGYPITTSAT